ncbi:chitinase-like protein 3 [Acomys russatus]|uniref:chitinase-like protein 3 n=1 Tax=Acomys russatus TaxID=60746 RepID=UPI0021E30EA4|nr:chitinase-like protein 3 [Acomys russatus]
MEGQGVGRTLRLLRNRMPRLRAGFLELCQMFARGSLHLFSPAAKRILSDDNWTRHQSMTTAEDQTLVGTKYLIKAAGSVLKTTMPKVIFLMGLNLLLNAQLGSAYQLMCYFNNWPLYLPGVGSMETADIDPCLCTHLIYSFAGIWKNNITMSKKKDLDDYKDFNDLKKRNNKLKTLLSIGCWNFGAGLFTTMVSTRESRESFITSVINLLREYGFDGLNLAWQYPGCYGSPPRDKHLFIVLMQEIRKAFEKEVSKIKKPRLLVTAAVAGVISTIHSGYEILQLSQSLDYIQVMTYDLHGSWDGYTGENSPLYKSPTDTGIKTFYNINSIMDNWKSKGAAPEKLIVGFPAYGHTFILSDATKTGIGSPSNRGGHPGLYTKKTGVWAYYEICTFLENGATQVWNSAQQVPYAYHGNEWVGYDNIKSFHIKAQWIKRNNFGGAMIWAIDMDDYTGTFCDQGRFPLTSSLKKALKVHSENCEVTAIPASGTDSRNSSSGALESAFLLSSK